MRVSIGGPVMNDEWPEDDETVPTPVVARPDKVCLGPDGGAFTCPPLRHHACGQVDRDTDPTTWREISGRARSALEHACSSCKYLLVCTGVDLNRPLRPRPGIFGLPRAWSSTDVTIGAGPSARTRPG